MFDYSVGLSEDAREGTIKLTGMTEGLKVNADELEELIRILAALRASMQPVNEPIDIIPNKTLINAQPAIRWQVVEDPDFPNQCRLHLLHPGFGWIWIPLDRPSYDDLSAKVRLFLQGGSSRVQ